MAYESHLATSPKRAVNQNENSTRFAKLKPTCVKLLGLITSKEGWRNKSNSLHSLLIELKDLLASFELGTKNSEALSPSLINYIFFPLAQLLRGNTIGSTRLPDRLLQQLFEILTLLSKDWWRSWSDAIESSNAKDWTNRREQWKVWEQLLILGAATLEGSPKGDRSTRRDLSEETQLAVTLFLYELLLPRVSVCNRKEKKAEVEWEWDGEEKLPSLDDYDEIVEDAQRKSEAIYSDHQRVYPSSSHLKRVYEDKTSRGAIAHAMSSALTLAADEQVFPPARIAAIKVSRVIIDAWLGAASRVEDEQESGLVAVVQDDLGDHCSHFEFSTFGPRARADRVATFLPGYVSSMARILTAKGGKSSSAIISQALQGLSSILVTCLSDAANEDILAHDSHVNKIDENVGPSTIEALVEKVHKSGIEQHSSPSYTEGNGILIDKKISPKDVPIGRNLQWLESSVSHIVIALHSIKSLASHDNSEVQIAMLDLACGLLNQCTLVMQMQREALRNDAGSILQQLNASLILLNSILDIAGSSSVTKIVASRAAEILQIIFSPTSKCREGLEKLLVQDMQSTLISLPDLLEAQKDDDICKNTSRLVFAFRLATSDYNALIPFNEKVIDMLHAANKSDQWVVRLLWSITIDNAASLERGTGNIMLKNLTASTSESVMTLLVEIGQSCARLAQNQCKNDQDSSKAFELIVAIMNQASSHRVSLTTDKTSRSRYSRLFSQNALLLAAQMMRGVAHILDDAIISPQTSKAAKKLRRVAQRLARDMIGNVCVMWEEDEEELLQPDLHRDRDGVSNEIKSMKKAEQNNALTIERRQGLQDGTPGQLDVKAGPALRLDFVKAATLTNGTAIQSKQKTIQQLQREAITQLDHSDALLFSILSSSAKILGPSIQSHLLSLLYPIICGVASSSDGIQTAAAQAMDELSQSAGFASVQACVSSHADYILGFASHRLISSLSAELHALTTLQEQSSDSIRLPLICAQSAPLVLIEVIRMLGGEALTLVQDAIDEVLDAIDRHHQQPKLCDDLLGVLDRLVEVMHNDERIKGNRKESKSTASINAAKMLAYKPDIEKDMTVFEKWWNDRNKVNEGIREENYAIHDGLDKQEEDEKATSSQLVLVSILQKVIPFLTHSSATIRIRSLRLLNRGVELLCLQGRTVEPLQVVSTAWPMIMSRLGYSLSTSLRRYEKFDVPSYKDLSERDFVVCIEACKLVNTLSKYLIDYLGTEKVLRQAIPRLLLLLKIVERAEGRSKETTRQKKQSTFLLSNIDNKSVMRTKSTGTFKPIQKYTPLFTMAQVVLACLDTIINALGPQISEADLFAFATHPTLLSCLDRRQDEILQISASRFYYSTIAKRNENLVWLIVKGATDTDGLFPTFLHRPELQLSDIITM